MTSISRSRRGIGFTLFELLIVMGVIAFLAAVGVSSFAAIGKGRALQSAQSELHAFLRVARGQAILEGTEARLLVNYDASDPERFLRFYGVAVRSRENPDQWRAAGCGAHLPDGVYVVPQDHDAVTFVNWPAQGGADVKSDYRASNGDAADSGVMKLEFPANGWRPQGEEGAPEWIAIAFEPSGELGVVDPAASGALPIQSLHLVLSPARWDGSGKLVYEDSARAIGVRLRPTGRSFAVSDPAGL